MKKHLLVLVLLSILTFTSFGQINFLDIGVEGGFSLASLRGNEIIDNYHSSRIAHTEGIFAQYNFNKLLSVRTGGYFQLKGSTLEIVATDDNGSPIGKVHGNENFSYITIPLLLRATFGKKFNYFVNAGPYLAFLVKQYEHTETFQGFPETNPDRTDLFKKTETGLSFGIGLAYSLHEKFAFSFETRYDLGLTDTSKVPVYGNGVIKTNTLDFLLGFFYKIGKRKNKVM